MSQISGLPLAESARRSLDTGRRPSRGNCHKVTWRKLNLPALGSATQL
jgi:hypothetical protein